MLRWTLLAGFALLSACGGEGSTQAGGSGGGGSGGAPGSGGSAAGGGAGGGDAGAGGIGPLPPSTFTTEDLEHHRNRLLDTFVVRRGATDRCSLWTAMTIVEKGVFLTHTDMLGHRSCFENASVPVDQMNGQSCDASECTCDSGDPCTCAPGEAQAIDHVFLLWAVNGSDTSCCGGTNCCNGGGEWHRIFFSADDHLIDALRAIHSGLPEWAESNDFAGPHDPFTQSSETQQGSPRGQSHYWSADGEAEVLQRNGVEGVFDPHVVELDNDYNFIHDSNPEGYYSNTYGREHYVSAWSGRGDALATNVGGNGAPAGELPGEPEWLPVCGPTIATTGVAPTGGAPSTMLALGTSMTITGAGFLASGNRVYLRTRTMAITVEAGSPLLVSESATAIEVILPPDLGAGEGFVYVESGGALSNGIAITLLP